MNGSVKRLCAARFGWQPPLPFFNGNDIETIAQRKYKHGFVDIARFKGNTVVPLLFSPGFLGVGQCLSDAFLSIGRQHAAHPGIKVAVALIAGFEAHRLVAVVGGEDEVGGIPEALLVFFSAVRVFQFGNLLGNLHGSFDSGCTDGVVHDTIMQEEYCAENLKLNTASSR